MPSILLILTSPLPRVHDTALLGSLGSKALKYVASGEPRPNTFTLIGRGMAMTGVCCKVLSPSPVRILDPSSETG